MRRNRTSTPSSAAGLGTVPQRAQFGERLRHLRRQRGLTLAEVAERSGLAISTISKAERGLTALTYDRLLSLARAFDLELGPFIADPVTASRAGPAVVVTRAGAGARSENPYYVMEMLCTDRPGKRMTPLIAQIKAHSAMDFDRAIVHRGEEFSFVLRGVLDLLIEGMSPIRLEQGDCVYFDSGRGHTYVSVSDEDALVVTVCLDEADPESEAGPSPLTPGR